MTTILEKRSRSPRIRNLITFSAVIMLLFCVIVALSPLGKIRLGGKGATPDYSRMSWFSMLFGAGMGIGLVFYGVAEPVSHFNAAMAGGGAAPLVPPAIRSATTAPLPTSAHSRRWMRARS